MAAGRQRGGCGVAVSLMSLWHALLQYSWHYPWCPCVLPQQAIDAGAHTSSLLTLCSAVAASVLDC